jgi:hypothetical protein
LRRRVGRKKKRLTLQPRRFLLQESLPNPSENLVKISIPTMPARKANFARNGTLRSNQVGVLRVVARIQGKSANVHARTPREMV